MRYKYFISAIAKQPKHVGVNLEGDIEIYGVRIFSVQNKGEGAMKFLIELEGDDDQKALDIAKRKMESVVHALALTFNLPLILTDPKIERKVSTPNEQMIEVAIYEYLSVTAFVRMTIKPSTELVMKASELAKKIDSMPKDRRDILSRVLKWYCRAMNDEDQVDRFIGLYVALEVIGEFKHPEEKKSTRKVKSVLINYFLDQELEKGTSKETAEKLAKKLTDEIVKVRNSILHKGVKENEGVKYINYMAEVVLKNARDMIG